jgi:DNA uptake protein ComE-like DNA-binding protein
MKFADSNLMLEARREHAAVLIVVLWFAIGLVSIALYFAHSMTYELRASDNRADGLASEQAIEGAARYVSYILSNYATNGTVPTTNLYDCAAVPVGDAHFWIIGRDPSATTSSSSSPTTSTGPYFGLIDEASKLNLNYVSSNTLSYLPNMTSDFADAIVDWRGTNGTADDTMDYTQLGYADKHAPFETVDELRLVYGSTMGLLFGDDANCNGILDANETSQNGVGTFTPGLFDYLTVYTRQPNFNSAGTMLTNVNTEANLRNLLQTDLSSSRATQILDALGFGGGERPAFTNLMRFYLRSGMTSSEFVKIADDVTDTTNLYTNGLLNINTATATVMTALFEGIGVDEQTAESAAQSLVTYRQQNSDNITAVSWIVDALGRSSSVVQDLANADRDYITTRTYQFTADIAAVGPYGRGYRRVKFIFDTSQGTPKILYRQDLSRLGWALGDQVRSTWVTQETP